jgi:putative copper resistance protein D
MTAFSCKLGPVPHWLEIALVVVHVLAAIVWVGGTVALTFIAVPAIRRLTGEPRQVAMRALGRRWRPIGWTALPVLVATGIPLAAHVLPGSGGGAKAVFGVKMGAFLTLLVTAYFHDFVLGPRLAAEIREGCPQESRRPLVVVGWTSFTLTLALPILGVVLAEIV